MVDNGRSSSVSRPFAVGRLLFNSDEQVAGFINDHIGCDFQPEGEYRCVGVLDADGFLVSGACFHNFFGTGAYMSGASSRPRRWATRSTLAGIFAYAFKTLSLTRLTALVAIDNPQARSWNEASGFQREGVMRKAGDGGVDLIVYGMLEPECRWIHGKEKQQPSSGS